MSSRITGFLDRISTMADRCTAMEHLSAWMTRNLRLNGRPYTFKNHEMQEQIASDQHPDKCVKKCSQIGLTELSFRLTAAIAAVTRSRIIYVFPSAKFSVKMSTDRFTPIVLDSPILATMQHSDSKSAEMRKLGNSTVYFTGASGTRQAISIPATHLFIDEKDFCDPTVLGQFASRLRHAEEDPKTGIRGHTTQFSTPTLPNYGVSKDFDDSDQKSYTVKCSCCNHVQVPDYYHDYVVPGYDGEIALFDKEMLNNPKYRVAEAYVKCQKCGTDLWKDLLDPSRREWVAKYPERIMSSGYAISPIDVPKYNSVPSIFFQMRKYTVQDHRNFVLGLEYEDANNSFLSNIFDKDPSHWVTPEEADLQTLSGVRIGVDIGKVAHVTVGKGISSTTKHIHVIYMATLDKKNGVLADQIQKLIDAFRPDVTVLDAAPDFTTPQLLIADNRYGTVFGCEYRRSVPDAFSNISADAETGVVKAARGATLSELMQAHNAGRISYPRHKEVDVLKDHYRVTKKVTIITDMGEEHRFPKPDDPDHYAHAMNYLMIADEVADDPELVSKVVGVAPAISAVRLGGNLTDDSDNALRKVGSERVSMWLR